MAEAGTYKGDFHHLYSDKNHQPEQPVRVLLLQTRDTLCTATSYFCQHLLNVLFYAPTI
jgi:hypothetical protein